MIRSAVGSVLSPAIEMTRPDCSLITAPSLVAWGVPITVFVDAIGEPGIGALFLEGGDDPFIDGFILQDVAVGIDKDSDRNAPGTLA